MRESGESLLEVGQESVKARPPYLAPYRYGISVLQTTTGDAVIRPRPTSKDLHATAGYSYALTTTPGVCMYDTTRGIYRPAIENVYGAVLL